MTEGRGRTVIASVTISLDGCSAGPGDDLTGMTEHAGSPETMAWFTGVYRNVTTALMGRTNYEGFHGYWPPVARDPASSPRGRDLAVWLDEVEKVVFSRTLTEATWSNARIAEREPAEEVRALKAAEGRDIMVVNSASIIHALLRADVVDEMRLTLVPLVWGGGLRIFPDGIPRTEWALASSASLPGGTLGLQYRRTR
jgi:dihydrofolate reductase